MKASPRTSLDRACYVKAVLRLSFLDKSLLCEAGPRPSFLDKRLLREGWFLQNNRPDITVMVDWA